MIAGIVTAILLAIFLGGLVWLFVIRKPADFDAASRMALKESDNERSS